MKSVRTTLIHPEKTDEVTVEPSVVRQLTDYHTVVSTPTANVPNWMDVGGQIVAAKDPNTVITSFKVHDIDTINISDTHIKNLPNWNCKVTTFHPLF